MSDELQWLERVSQENNAANIKPEDEGLKKDEAEDHVGGDESLENEGKNTADAKVKLKEDLEPDDAAAIVKAEGEVSVSAEDSQSPDLQIELQEPTASQESEDDGEQGGEAEPAASEEEPVVDPAVEPEPAVQEEPITPVETETEGSEPAVAEEPAAVEEPVVTEEPVADAASSELVEGEEPGVQAETNAEPEAQIPVEIDPVTEIKEGTDAAVAEAEANGAPELTQEGEKSVVSEEGFTGGLIGFIVGGATWVPFVGAGVNSAVKAKRMKMQQDIEEISKRIAKLRAGEIEEAKKKGLDVAKKLKNPDWIEIAKSAFLGSFFGPFYGARQGSEIENLNDKLRAKMKELEDEIEKAGIEVSNEDFSIDGGESDDVEAVEPEVSVESEFDEAAIDVTAEFDGIDDDVSQLSKMGTALEAYSVLLKGEMDRDHQVNPALVQAIQIGLESFNEPLLVAGVPSLEDFNDSIGRLTVSNEFTKGMGEKAKAVGTAVLEAIKRMLARLADMMAEIRNNTSGLETANAELIKRLDALRKDTTGTIEVKGAQRLMIGDNFGGDNAKNITALRNVADRFLVDYPKFNQKLFEGVADVIDKHKEMGVQSIPGSEFATVLDNAFKPGMFGAQTANKGVVPQLEGKYDAVFVTPVVLGNGRIAVGKNTPTKNGLAALSDAWQVSFVRNEPTNTPTEVKLPGIVQLKQIAKELDGLLGQIPKYVEAGRQMSKEAFILKFFGRESVTGAEAPHAISGLVQSMATPTGHFIGHLVNTIRVQQAFVAACIAKHEAGAAA